MYYYIFGAALIILIVWTVGSYLVVRGLEEPTYTVLELKDGYEIRQYEPYIIAEATVTGRYEKATNEGFRIIADYIFGNNTSKQSISMTTPVLENTSEKISMTSPVLNTLDGEETKTISFVLPAKYTLDSLPQPNNERVTLREVPARTTAALRFTWYATASRVANKKQALQTLLERDNLQVTGTIQVAQYNPPLSMPLTLRNEIIIPIEYSSQ